MVRFAPAVAAGVEATQMQETGFVVPGAGVDAKVRRWGGSRTDLRCAGAPLGTEAAARSGSMPACEASVNRLVTPVVWRESAYASDGRIVEVWAIERRKNCHPAKLIAAAASVRRGRHGQKRHKGALRQQKTSAAVPWRSRHYAAGAIVLIRWTYHSGRRYEKIGKTGAVDIIATTGRNATFAATDAFETVISSLVCRTTASSRTGDLCRANLHGCAIGKSRQVAEDHLLGTVDRCPGYFMGIFLFGVGDAAIGDLDPLAVGDTGLDFGPHRMAIFVPPEETLLATGDDGIHRQGPYMRAFDNHFGIGVHSRQDLAIGVGQVNLGAERTAPDIEGPARARDAGRNLLVAVRPRSTLAFVPMRT